MEVLTSQSTKITDKALWFSPGYLCFTWSLAQGATRSGADNTERDQENGPVRVWGILTLGSADGRSPLLALMPFGDDIVVQGPPTKANPQVSKRALEVLHKMR